MPARLRPTAPLAADAILVGDPGRALMLAQELLRQPKMSNHARGLWGYTGATEAGGELTIQSTGMGGPSATVVLRDLAELGLRRAVRIGTGAALSDLELGQIVVVEEARASPGSLGVPGTAEETRNCVRPDEAMKSALERAFPGGRGATVVSLDRLHDPEHGSPSLLADLADMQTAALLEAGAELEVAVAALLIVNERSGSGQLADEELEKVAKAAGEAAAAALSG
jgi:purine-nucleoside phosphorylase